MDIIVNSRVKFILKTQDIHGPKTGDNLGMVGAQTCDILVNIMGIGSLGYSIPKNNYFWMYTHLTLISLISQYSCRSSGSDKQH